MSKAAAAALGIFKSLHHVPVGPDDGLENELGHALAVPQHALLTRGIEQHDEDLSRVVRIDEADPLGHRQPLARAKPAAR